MVRLDYCEIYNCLVHYANIEDDSQDDMTYALFAAYCQDPDVDPIDIRGTAVTRWRRGEYNVSPNVRGYYVNPDNAGKLASAIKTSFLGKMPDYRPCIKRLIKNCSIGSAKTQQSISGKVFSSCWIKLPAQRRTSEYASCCKNGTRRSLCLKRKTKS